MGSKAASKATEASREAASKAKEAKVGVDRLVGVYQWVVVVYKKKVVPTGVEGFFVKKKFGLVI